MRRKLARCREEQLVGEPVRILVRVVRVVSAGGVSGRGLRLLGVVLRPGGLETVVDPLIDRKFGSVEDLGKGWQRARRGDDAIAPVGAGADS